jgi:transposase
MLTAGIDTAKHKLDVAVHGQPGSFTVENNPAGWTLLAARLARIGVRRVGIEATGGYERGVTRYLRQQGFIVVVLQPLQVKAFAMLRLRRAKSDPIDAALVAACTFLLDAQNKMPPDPRYGLAMHRTRRSRCRRLRRRVALRLCGLGVLEVFPHQMQTNRGRMGMGSCERPAESAQPPWVEPGRRGRRAGGPAGRVAA